MRHLIAFPLLLLIAACGQSVHGLRQTDVAFSASGDTNQQAVVDCMTHVMERIEGIGSLYTRQTSDTVTLWKGASNGAMVAVDITPAVTVTGYIRNSYLWRDSLSEQMAEAAHRCVS